MKIVSWLLGPKKEHEGFLVGLDGCGKTTLLYRWKLGEITSTFPTIGFNRETIPHRKGWDFTIFDFGGCDKMRDLTRHYFTANHFVIFIHDCGDHDRLEEQLEEFHRQAKNMIDRGCRYLWVIFNKQDLLHLEKRPQYIRELKRRYEMGATCYSASLIVQILDIPDLSATTSPNIHVILDNVKQTLEKGHSLEQILEKGKDAPESLPGTNTTGFEQLKRDAESMVDTDAITAEQFWALFESGDLPVWDHYNHLKAGYFVMINSFATGASLFDCAEEFIKHLQRLRRSKPERFRNTTHRTMTIFWLSQVQVAALNYKHTVNLEAPLYRDDFGKVLLHTPELTFSGLWREYYSKDRMFSLEARETWCLPDLKPLRSITVAQKEKPPTEYTDDDNCHLVGFALTIFQRTLESKSRRGAVIKQALSVLESSIIRRRVSNSNISPYSETQAYFWIQFVHAAVASLALSPAPQRTVSMPDRISSAESLTLPAFKTLFSITGEEWREYYSPACWHSVGARMAFVNPDLKPLPGIIAVPSQDNMQRAYFNMAGDFGLKTLVLMEIPSAEELAIMAAVVVNEAAVINIKGSGGSIKFGAHARLLLSLYTLLVADSTKPSLDDHLSHKARSSSITSALEVPCPDIDGVTQRMFWTQQVLAARGKTAQSTDSFENFVHSNSHLAYEQLPMMYYSLTLWTSNEAKNVFIPPDRKSYSSILNST